jgi:hypothetical protein
MLRRLGLAYEQIDSRAAARRWPQINFEGVTNIHLEREGGYLLARHACEAVARELVRAGGTYRQVGRVTERMSI